MVAQFLTLLSNGLQVFSRLTPVSKFPAVFTPVTNFPLLTPVTNFPLLTPVANFPLLTPVTNFPLLTPVTNFPLLTPVANFPLLTPVTNFPLLTLVANFPLLTPATQCFRPWNCLHVFLLLVGFPSHQLSANGNEKTAFYYR